jgi:hypothetical protein
VRGYPNAFSRVAGREAAVSGWDVTRDPVLPSQTEDHLGNPVDVTDTDEQCAPGTGTHVDPGIGQQGPDIDDGTARGSACHPGYALQQG